MAFLPLPTGGGGPWDNASLPIGGGFNLPQFPSEAGLGGFGGFGDMVGGGFGGGLSLGGMLGGNQKPQYVLSADGKKVAFHTMMEMGLTAGSRLPSEPIEKGSFANYNRIIEPLAGTCRLALQGTASEIQNTLDSLDDLKNGDKKIEFITPFDSYDNLMLESYDYRRDSNTGFNVLFVDLRLVEIREVETQKTTTSVDEPPPVTEEAAADGSCVSGSDFGETPTYEPSSYEADIANTGAGDDGGGGGSSSVLHDMFGKL